MNTTRPLITVFGATGAQGGHTARALLAQRAFDGAQDRRWRVRAVTRRPQSQAALALAALGAEIVHADLDDAPSVQRAMHGAFGAFCVTDFWSHHDPRRELEQARNLADACAEAHVEHVIWSTLEDTRQLIPADGRVMPVLQGHYNVPHMDAKGEANERFFERRLAVTLLLTSFYWDNLIDRGMGPQRGADGALVWVLPMGDVPLPGIAACDIGHCAAALFDQPPAQRRVGIAGEHLSGAQMAALMSEVFGERVHHVAMPPADFARLPFPGAADLANMFAYKQHANAALREARSVDAARSLHPGLLDFRGWLALNGKRIPVPPMLRVSATV